MNRLSILLLTMVVLGTNALATCYPKYTRENYESNQSYWSNKIKELKKTENQKAMQAALEELGTACMTMNQVLGRDMMTNAEGTNEAQLNRRPHWSFEDYKEKIQDLTKKNAQEELNTLNDTCRTMSRIVERLDRIARAEEAKPVNPIDMKSSDIPDKDFFKWSMRGSMDGSVFGSHVGDEDFRNRVFALNDKDFTKLMTELKIWHGGTPLMLLVDYGRLALYAGILREFWDRIKKLPKDQILQILKADYLGDKFSTWIQIDANRRNVPSDILQEMDTLLKNG